MVGRTDDNCIDKNVIMMMTIVAVTKMMMMGIKSVMAVAVMMTMIAMIMMVWIMMCDGLRQLYSYDSAHNRWPWEQADVLILNTQ